MTKMQIIAKTILAVLGIYAVVTLCWYLSLLVPLVHRASPLSSISLFAIFTVFIAVIVFFLIFKNDSLARKMAGHGEKLNPTTQKIWLVASLRLGAIFAGLILLSASIPTIVKVLLSPMHIRPFINEIFVFKSLPKSLELSIGQWSTLIYNSLKAILAIYLIAGAPHFIRQQLKSTPTSNPERT